MDHERIRGRVLVAHCRPVAVIHRAGMTAAALSRIESYRDPRDAARHVTGRLLARFLAAHFVPAGTPFEVVTDTADATRGRPLVEVPGGIRAPWVSISHTTDLVVACASWSECGVDVERRAVGPSLLEARRHAFTPGESSRLDHLVASGGDAVGTAIRWWTHKEAVAKAWGTGFLTPQTDPSILDVRTDLAHLGGRTWRLRPLAVPGDHVGSLATPEKDDTAAVYVPAPFETAATA